MEGGPRSSLTYKHIIHEDLLPQNRSKNVLLEETDTYKWALKSWSPCTKTCGGGTISPDHPAPQGGGGHHPRVCEKERSQERWRGLMSPFDVVLFMPPPSHGDFWEVEDDSRQGLGDVAWG